MTSQHAQVSKLIKQHCKSIGIKCRAVSQRYAGGNSVRLTIYNQPPAVFEALREHCSQYEQGRFDGMTDMYEYSNSRDDIPQTKYLFVNNDHSDETKQAAWDSIRETFGEAKDGPEKYIDAGQWRIGDQWADTFVHRFLNGSLDQECAGDFHPSADFWAERASKLPVKTPVNGVSYQIEEHTHTKKGFQMFLVITNRLDRADFNALRETAKSMNGWYSRQWSQTPGGFAFKTREEAQEFADTLAPCTSEGPDTQETAPGAQAAAMAEETGIDYQRCLVMTNTD